MGDTASSPIAINLQTLGDGRGGFFTGLKVAQGLIEFNVALTEDALVLLIENLPDALADVKRQKLGLHVPQQAAAPKLYDPTEN